METIKNKDHDLLIKLSVQIDTLCKCINSQSVKFDKRIEDIYNKLDEQKKICTNKNSEFNKFAGSRPSLKTVFTIVSPLVGILLACIIGLYSYTNEVNAKIIKHDVTINHLEKENDKLSIKQIELNKSEKIFNALIHGIEP